MPFQMQLHNTWVVARTEAGDCVSVECQTTRMQRVDGSVETVLRYRYDNSHALRTGNALLVLATGQQLQLCEEAANQP
ncbi:hypothetical protein [Lampropedia aestuarii]|nr:hypothetical protein [Lampropedia aestuarii]MDH5858686.1 hypothetical protein [Lampropedia aestuarii]